MHRDTEMVMQLGTFESVFERSTLAETFQAVKDGGFSCVQFDYASAGLNGQPSTITNDISLEVKEDARRAEIRIASVSGTFNMIHPDHASRTRGLAWLDAIAASCATLGTRIVTLCTGTRDSGNMWRGHADNGSPGAWSDLQESMKLALAIAERHDVRLVIEPEPANVVNNADRAETLLSEMDHPLLKIVLDPANIIAGDHDRSADAALDHAFHVLGSHIILAHAKDVDEDGRFCAAGTGIVPWAHYHDLLRRIAFDGDVIFHTLTEEQASSSISVFAQ